MRVAPALLVVLAVVLVVVGVAPARAQEAIYLVRHAERVDDTTQSLLSPKGTRGRRAWRSCCATPGLRPCS